MIEPAQLKDVKRLKTIFGQKQRPQHRRKRGLDSVRLEKVIERPSYDLTVFKLHFKKLTLKMYDKGDRVLRIEAVAHNVKELKCGSVVEKLPEQVEKLKQMVVSFLNVIQVAHRSFLDEGSFESLSKPSQRGERRLAGVDLNNSRMRSVLEAVVALSLQPDGFLVNDLAFKVQTLSGLTPEEYNMRRAAYDLSKLRGKKLVLRRGNTRRYVVSSSGVRVICGCIVLLDRVIKPVLAGAARPRRSRPPKNVHPLDVHYQNLRKELAGTFETIGLAA